MKRPRSEDVDDNTTTTANTTIEGDGGNDDNKVKTGEGEQERRSTSTKKRRRWGVEASHTAPTSSMSVSKEMSSSNGGVVSSTAASTSGSTTAAALKSKIAERLAALKNKRQASAGAGAVGGGLISAIPSNVQKKAKTFELNLNEIKPSFDDKSERKDHNRPIINPYLAHTNVGISTTISPQTAKASSGMAAAGQDQASTSKQQEVETILDSRLAGGHTAKNRLRSKPLSFVEPGTFVKIAERKREKAALAAKAGFASGRKEGLNVVSTGIDKSITAVTGEEKHGATERQDHKPLPLNDYENPSYAHFPVAVEWWDVSFLPPYLRNEIAQKEGTTISKKLGGGKSTTGTFGVDVASLTSAIVTQQKDPKQLFEKAKGDKRSAEDAIVQDATGTGTRISDSNSDATDNCSNDRSADDGINQFRQQCFDALSLEYSKTYALVQHPPPIVTASSKKVPPIPTAYLTKDELKRRRKLRRAEKQREQKDLQAAGLIPAPEPRLTLSNFMQILGNQAVTDPSKMEQIALKQIASRQRKHIEMNEERKLTKEQKSEKRYAKYHEDISKTGLHVAFFFVKDMSHTYYRAKIDLNAQQNGITGAVLSSKIPEMSVVITEGGPKAIQRFIRLMTHRIDWTGKTLTDGNAGSTVDGAADEQEDAEQNVGIDQLAAEGTSASFNSSNFCALVWTGEALKRTFNTFVFQTCTTAESARKVLESKGVAHFWDQAIEYSEEA